MTNPIASASLPLGEGRLDLTFPASWSVTRAVAAAVPPVPALEAELESILAGPLLDGRRLAAGVPAEARVTIVIPDATRPSPDATMLRLLHRELRAAGVPDERITVLVALGMHRPSTPDERRAKLGDLHDRIRIEDAQGGRDEEYVDLGTLEGDVAGVQLPAPVPVHIHRRVVDCDVLLATGVVEPHQYAGFSGGRKTVAIGCAGRRTIGVLHGLSYLEHPGTRLGSLGENPVHAALGEIARRVGLRACVNVALDAEGRVIGAAGGPPEEVLERLVARLEPVVWTPVDADPPFDVVIAGVGHPKDANLYQASRALTYLAFSPRPVLRDGGWVVLAAACSEGAGQGPGEEEFLRWMRAGSNPSDVLARLRREGFGAGGQRAVMVAKALERYRCLLVGPHDDGALAAACHMDWAPASAGALFARLGEHVGSAPRVLVVDHALSTLPTPRSAERSPN